MSMYPDTKFDMIFGCNLIDRLHTPDMWVLQSKVELNLNQAIFLINIEILMVVFQDMLSENGLLIISSPYTWKPEHTDPDKWIGGYVKDDKKMFTQDGLEKMLSPDLKLLEVLKVPFVIPDSDGTFQYTYSNCTVFGKNK